MLAQSFLSVVQVGALGLLVMIPAAAIDTYDRVAGDALREARGRAEAAEEHDSVIAAIAEALLSPPAAPDGWELASRQEVAFGRLPGDSMQILVDRTTDRFLVVVIDVAGHGSLAALQAYRLRAEAEALWREGLPAGRIVASLASSVEDLGTIATAVVLAVDRGSGSFTYVNAGHPAPLVVHGARLTRLDPTAPILGAGLPLGATEGTGRMDHGDLLVTVTDGVIEARRRGGEPLGEPRVETLVRTWAPHGPEQVASMCLDAARHHAKLRLPDDALVLVLRRP
jgi:serine phosphatase RsbU (regulator of sigma subunit)